MTTTSPRSSAFSARCPCRASWTSRSDPSPAPRGDVESSGEKPPHPHEETRTMMYRHALAALGLVAACLALSSAGAEEKQGKAVELFNGKDLSGWKTFLDPKDKGK